MANLKLKAATPTDLSSLMDLEKLCFTTDRFTRKQYRYFLSRPSVIIIVAKYDRHVVGNVVVLFRKNSTKARIYSIAVHPQYQKQGIAQKLHDFIKTLVIKKHCDEIILEVRKDNKPALAFYRKNGYELFGEYKKFYEDNTDALRLHKIIKRHGKGTN